MSPKKQPAAKTTGSTFDDEVDGARQRLEAALRQDEGFDDLAALQTLAPILEDKIS
jgi:hypothetical protein